MAVRVAIVGAGPAGLYLAYLLKRSKLKVEVEVFEQNPADATFGFGLVFSERALEFLNDEDPDTLAAIRPALEHWNDSILVHKGREVRIDGMGYTGIGRLRLLQILQARACSVGVEPKYLHTIDNLETCGDADLIVGADGVNSVVRRGYEDVFGTTVTYLTNRFAWFGTAKKFEALTHTFVETGLGHFNAHHHPHAPDMSTFVVEVDEPTFFRAGFDEMDADQAKAVCEQVFTETLDGHRLVSNKSIWRQFPKVWNERWSIGNRVLVGDALHTAHFSIGSGTRLAMEDAIALAKALEQHASDFPAALAAYEEARKLVVTRLVTAANASAAWYELFAEHMTLTPMDFAMSYITRSGRVDLERLRRSSPAFVAAYEKSRTGKNTREADVIYLVRHGETTWNRVGRQQGHNDSPLTELGIEQARAAGRLLQRAIPDIHSICIETSPLGRARQTALIISEVLGLDPSMILVTPLLIEHHLGCWQGLTHAEIDARYPGAWQTREQNKWDYVVPDGESYALVAERAKQWLAKQRHAPITIAVTHAIISRTIQGAYGGFTPSQTVARSHPQDRIYRLHAGRVEEMSCEE